MNARKTIPVIVLLVLSLCPLFAADVTNATTSFTIGHVIEAISGEVNLSFSFYTGASESSTLELATSKELEENTDIQFVGRIIGSYENGSTSSATINYVFYWTPFECGDNSISYTMTINAEDAAGTAWTNTSALPDDALGSFARTISLAKGVEKTSIFANLYLQFNEASLKDAPSGDYSANFVTRVVSK